MSCELTKTDNGLKGGLVLISKYIEVTKEYKLENNLSKVDYIHAKLKAFKDDARISNEDMLCLGMSFLLLFMQDEWTGPSFNDDILSELSELSNQETITLLSKGSDVVPLKHPILLLMALKTFELCIRVYPEWPWSKYWLMHGLFVHQLVLEEASSPLQEELELTLGELLLNNAGYDEVEFQLLAARIRLYYGHIDKAAHHIEQATEKAGLKFAFTGLMGKRTKYQDFDLAQLSVIIENTLTSSDSGLEQDNDIPSAAPKNIPLDDDVRMERVKFTGPNQVKDANLHPKQVAVLLATLMYRKKALPADELTIEESKTLISVLVDSKSSWSVKLSILLLRSQLENSSRRTIERSMNQVQSICDDVNSDELGVTERVQDFFISYLPTKREVEMTLGDLLLSVGAIKSALEIFLRLQQWELAITCYNLLDLRHKAKELIEVELSKEETPKLLCLLGDATDDVLCYEKAWILSKESSARAQRHWANFLYDRKNFKESIDHFEKSLSINSLQDKLWFRLGFAALHEEQWELSAKAYRRYCTLEQDSFEAWNNLARCYCETNQKDRAKRALGEALKIDTSNWRIWDNYMRVSADVKDFNEVLRSYNEIISLKKDSHVDMPVLVLIFKALLNNRNEMAVIRNGLISLLERLVEKPTKDEAELWTLLAEVYSLDNSVNSLNKQKVCLIKAHSKTITQPGWENCPDARERDIVILENLIPFAENDVDFRKMFVLLAKPSVSAILRSLPENTSCIKVKDAVQQWDFAWN